MSQDRRISRQENYAYSSSFNRGATFSNVNGSNLQIASRPVDAQSLNIQSQYQEINADNAAYLRYASELNNGFVISGSSDLTKISSLKNAILELRSNYFNSNSGLSVQGEKRDELDRRFLLIEHELDGLLRRNLEFSYKDREGTARNIDFTSLLNDKETEIVELTKRIENLEERLKRSNAREIEFESKITALKAENLTLRDRSYTGEKLDEAMKREARYVQAEKELQASRANFSAAASVWLNQLSKISAKYPNDRFILDGEITKILQRSGVASYNTNGFTTIELKSEKTVEVPVQDARTKHLILALANNLKRLSAKYPKLLAEMDEKLVEFFQQEVIDYIDIDSLDRVVEIVRFVPQAVRVENVYAYSSAKSRRVEFHLRVLIKALLEELEKVKGRYGAVLDIDEGVIGMINQEILGVVSVDDILKVFRTNGKIVEVERIVQRIVERIVQVPQVIPVEKYVEKIIEVPKYIQIEKIIHVPVEIIKVVDNIVEKLVEVPTIQEKVVEVETFKERIVEVRVEVPKIVEVEKIVERIVINTEVNVVEVPVNHIIPEIREIINTVEKPVTVETIVERIVEVPVFVEKIVEKIVEVPKVVEVKVIQEKLVIQKVIEVVGETQVAVRQVIKEVIVYVQKIVPIETVVQSFIEVTKVIEKPVPVRTVETIIKEVQVIREKLVPVIQIKEIEKVVNVIVEKIVQVEKIVDRRVDVPIIHEKIVTVPEVITKIVIEKVHVPYIITVKEFAEKIVYETKIVQVEKPVIQYIRDIQVVKCVIQKIVEVTRTVERIKEVKVKIDKIVEKLVQVPKVIEVEKIVEKIVVVPRIIEKIVEIPKFIEIIVEKIVEREVVKEVQCVVEKIIEVEKPVEVEKIKNVYIEIEKPIEKIVEKIVALETIVESKDIVEVQKEKIVSYCKEVPKEMIVEKICSRIVEKEIIVEVEKPCTLVVEVPVQVEKIIEKAVKVVDYHEKLVNSVEVIQKPVPAYIKTTQIKEVERYVEKVVEVAVPTVYSETKVVVQEKVVEVPTVIEKPVVVERVKTDIVQVEKIIEKVVEKLVEIPKVVSVEILVEKLVEKIQVVELQRIVPQLITIHKIIESVIEKIVPVITFKEVIVKVPVIEEKIVQVAVKQIDKQAVEVFIEKVIEVCKLRTETDVVNRIQAEIQIVDRYEKTQIPVYTTAEKIVEVPHILEKIVERIVILPQVVEVLKYVHEISESDSLGLSIGIDIQEQEKKYKQLYGITHSQLEVILTELRRLRNNQPGLSAQIDLLVKYLADFDRLAGLQRIVGVPHETIVEKEVSKAVLVPTKDSESIRNELALSALIEKLTKQIKRIKIENPNIKLKLDDEVGLIFYPEFYDKQKINVPADFNNSLNIYTQNIYAKVQTLGGNWGSDYEFLLANIIQDRISTANILNQANIEIQKARAISNTRGKALEEAEKRYASAKNVIDQLQAILKNHVGKDKLSAQDSNLAVAYESVNKFVLSSSYTVTTQQQPLRELGDFVGSGNDWSRLSSYTREREAEVDLLLKRIFTLERSNLKTEYSGVDAERTLATLRSENASLVQEIDRLRSTASIASNSANREKELELKLRTANARIQELESQLRTAELKLKELKDTKSSAASSVDPNINLISSQYSSSSSTDPYNKKPYDAPSYGVNSSYSQASNVSADTKSPSYVQQTTSNVYGGSYGNTTSAYQTSTSKLTSSGRDTNTGVAGSTYGTGLNRPTGSYGATQPTTSTTNTYGTTSVTANTPSVGQTSSLASSRGTTGVTTTPSYGTTGSYGATSASTYGTTGVTSATNYGNTTGTSGATTGSTYGATTASTYGNTTNQYGTTGATSGSSYGATGAYGSTTGTNYGTTGQSGSSGIRSGTTYGTSGTSGTSGQYGTTAVTGPTATGATGTSGLSATYGASGVQGSSYTGGSSAVSGSSSNLQSSLSSSGLRSGATGTSGYQFQSKKY